MAYPASQTADNGGRRVMTAGMWLVSDESTRGEVPRLGHVSSHGDIAAKESTLQNFPRQHASLTQQKTYFVLE